MRYRSEYKGGLQRRAPSSKCGTRQRPYRRPPMFARRDSAIPVSGRRKGFEVGPAVLAFACILCTAGAATAQDSGLAFLQLGVDAEAAGMGDAHVASTSGAFATFWNPAGLAYGSGNAVGVAHHIWIGEVRTYGIAGRFWNGAKSAFGLSVTSSSSGDIELRDRPGPVQGVFEARYLAAGLSYGRRIGALRVGATLKYLSEEIFSDRASGYGFDFGVQSEVAGGAVKAGATLRNVGQMNKLNTVATDLPTTFRAGVAFRPVRILTADEESLVNVVVAFDVSHNIPDERTQYHVGVGAEIFDVLVVRVGTVRNDSVRRFTAGVGFRYGAFGFDYALVTFESGFGGPGHILTLGYTW